MKTKLCLKNLEVGQVLPIVVLALFAIIAMAALLIDGGALLLNRRTAQAAADAGALAGAQQLCAGTGDPVVYAQMFVENNDALPESITVIGKEITVVTYVEHPSFFARIFGEPTLKAKAEAAAACVFPSITANPLPIAFYYEGIPIDQDKASCTDENPCGLVSWEYEELIEALTETPVDDQPLDAIYIVSDKTKICFADYYGEIVCSDMKNPETGGNRTFIDLGELKTTGSQNIGSIISEGLNEPLIIPIWVNGDVAVTSGAYNSQHYENLLKIPGHEELDARLVFVPVFNQYCVKNTKWECADTDDSFISKFNNNKQAYKLVGLAPFVVTCVTMSDECKVGRCITEESPPYKGVCPGFQYYDGDPNFKNAIEGYFVTEFPAEIIASGTEGVDAGMYIITLTK